MEMRPMFISIRTIHMLQISLRNT